MPFSILYKKDLQPMNVLTALLYSFSRIWVMMLKYRII